ncbi:MAG: hypothetical protein EHM23_26310 [Acidobacteria bacterium]|nr:MAG: hypothetical protein EHM23_26310 [Acidobacteriota bacterium]
MKFRAPSRPSRGTVFRAGIAAVVTAAILLLAGSPIGVQASAVAVPNLASAARPLAYLLGILGGVAILFALALARRPRFSPSLTSKPIDPLESFGKTLVDEDCAALTIAMTELAQGNLTAQLAIRSKPVNPELHPAMKEFVSVFNSVIKSFGETAREFNAVTETPCHRFCYVGADSFLSGRACGEALGRAVSGRGQVGIITSTFRSVGSELRRKGFASVIHHSFPAIEIVVTVEGTEKPEIAYQKTREVLQKYPDLQGLYVTIGPTPSAVARAVREAGRQGRIKLVCHDLMDETMRCVQDGTIFATLGQDPFAQGHEPVMCLYNYIAAGWRPPAPRILTALDLVTRENCHQFWHPERGIIEGESVAARRSSPLPARTSGPLRFAFISREESKFWEPVRQGVLAASEKLRPLDVTVDWIVPPENRERGATGADVYGPVIESAVAQGYDGIATGIFNRDLIPFINRAVASGIPVVTYNSEPTSLRGLVFAITDQAQQLMEHSRSLALTVSSVNQATTQINGAMNQISRGTVSQNEQVGQTHEALASLLKHIDEVSREASQGSTAAEEAAHAAGAGTEAVGNTLRSMQSIRTSVLETAQAVQALGEQSKKIDIIIKLIGGIAYQIKLLGINAAIEAAHAGEYGAGFLVVAGEIRSLAERTAQATREITDLVGSVQSRTAVVGNAMGSGLEKVSQGASLAEEAGKVLNEIRQAAEANRARLTAITASMAEMQSFSQQVGSFMESVAAVSEQNAAAVEEVTASSNEMSAQLEEVTQLARSLERMADSEQQLLAKFTLSGNGAGQR